MIPEIDLQLERHEVKPSMCKVCNQPMVAGVWVGRVSPKWARGIWYKVWEWWTWNVRGLKLGLICHEECIPEGFEPWKFEVEETLQVYYDPEAEAELIQMLEEELKSEK